MTNIDLEAIRARDVAFGADCNGSAWQAEFDRRALLAYVDALRAAAGKVTCATCVQFANHGQVVPDGGCYDCADLRKLLGESHE